MTDIKPTPSKWLTGRAQPPMWFRLLSVVALTAAAAALGVRRGVAVGIIAAVVYGSGALACAAAWQRTVAWSKQHPLLDSLLIVPLLFLAVAYLTDLPIGLCVVTPCWLARSWSDYPLRCVGVTSAEHEPVDRRRAHRRRNACAWRTAGRSRSRSTCVLAFSTAVS